MLHPHPFPAPCSLALAAAWVLLGIVAAPACAEELSAQDERPPVAEPAGEARPAAPPGPRERVGGLLALQVRSEARFLVPEGVQEPPPQRLELTYAFPDRCRWRLEPLADRPGGRRIVYRFGAATWVLPPGRAESRRLEGTEAEEMVTALELRRALLLWPHGFEWCGEGGQRSASLSGGLTLVARLGPDGERPSALESRKADGTLLEGLQRIEWREQDDRTWPARFDYEVAGRPLWREELLAIDLHARHVDAFFQPHDVRRQPVADPSAPRSIEVPPMALKRVALPKGTGWAAAAERFAALREQELARLAPLTVEDVVRAELGPSGEPAALLLALAGELPADLPLSFRLEPAGSALTILVAGPEAIDKALLERLARALPEGASTRGPLQARVHPAGTPGPGAQVFLFLTR